MAVAPDGGYLLAGNSESNKSGEKSEDLKDTVEDVYSPQDFWVVKIDEKGTKLWDKAYSGESWDNLNDLVVTPDGGYLLGGIGGDGKCGDKRCLGFWVVKISVSGQQQWSKKVGLTTLDKLKSIVKTADGGYLLGGTTTSMYGLESIIIIKIDAAGNTKWLQNYDEPGAAELLGQAFYTLAPAPDGGYFLSGYSVDKTWLVKINNSGKKLWDGYIAGVQTVNTIIALKNNNFLLTASTSGYQAVKMKYEFQANVFDWDAPYGGFGQDNLTTTIKTSDGGYLAGGNFNSTFGHDVTQGTRGKNDYWIVKTDANGIKLWDKRFGGADDDFLNRVIQTRDGGYLLAGSSLSGKGHDKSQASQGGRDYWIIKTDKQGNKEWDKVFGGSSYDELKKVIQLASGEYVLGGYSNSPAGGDKSQVSQGGKDLWLVKISSMGTKIWDKRFGGSADEELGSFTQTQDGGFILGGTSLSGKTGDKSQTSRGGQDYWVVKTDKAGKLLWDKTYGGTGEDEAYSVGLSQNRNVFITGTSTSDKNSDKNENSKGGKDYWLIELDLKGKKLWDKTYGGSQDDELRASTYTMAGHYVLVGSSYSGISGDKTQESQGESDYWMVEVDENGNKVQDKRYGGSGTDELRTVTQTKDGGLLLGGSTDTGLSGDKSQDGWGETDFRLVKIYPSTNPLEKSKTETVTEEEKQTLTDLITISAYPNPFSDKVTISFTLPETQLATIRIRNDQGREAAILFQGEAKANQKYEVEWQAGKQKAGMYLLQLQTPTGQNMQKLLLTK